MSQVSDHDYNTKLTQIHNSLPPLSDITKWTRYELGCRKFWGGNMHDIDAGGLEPLPQALSLLDQYRCFIVNHQCSNHNVTRVKTQLPQARHIVLYNAEKFTELAIGLKQPNRTFLEWIDRNQLEHNGAFRFPDCDVVEDVFRLDVDSVYFYRELVRKEVERCLEWLGLDTQLDPSVDQLIDRYFTLHGL